MNCNRILQNLGSYQLKNKASHPSRRSIPDLYSITYKFTTRSYTIAFYIFSNPSQRLRVRAKKESQPRTNHPSPPPHNNQTACMPHTSTSIPRTHINFRYYGPSIRVISCRIVVCKVFSLPLNTGRSHHSKKSISILLMRYKKLKSLY